MLGTRGKDCPSKDSQPKGAPADDSSYDFRNKKIAVIGNGSSAIQIIPSLQKVEGTALSCFMRSPTWISGEFGDQAMIQLGLDPKKTTCKSISPSPSTPRQLTFSHPLPTRNFRLGPVRLLCLPQSLRILWQHHPRLHHPPHPHAKGRPISLPQRHG